MLRFLKTLLYITLPVILVSFAIDLAVSRKLRESNHYAFGELPVWNAILDGNIHSEVLIYGSSRAWVHFDPTIIGSRMHTTAYNVGIDGQNFRLQYLRHQLLLAYNPPPKVILHSVDIFALQKSHGLYNSQQFLPYMLWNGRIRKALGAYPGCSAYDSYLPLIRYYGRTDAFKEALKLFLAPGKNTPMRVRGYMGRDITWDGEFEKVKDSLKSYSVEVDSSLITLFDQYLADCRARGIRVVLVYTPEYIEGQGFVRNREAIMDIYRGFSRKYGLPFYDYSYNYLSYDTRYFYNALHLNRTGAELFTNQLMDTLLSGPGRIL